MLFLCVLDMRKNLSAFDSNHELLILKYSSDIKANQLSLSTI